MEHIVSELRVLLHDQPFFISQVIGLEQDVIRHTQFADIVQEGAAPHVGDFFFVELHGFCQLDGHPGHALGMALGLLIAQIHGL